MRKMLKVLAAIFAAVVMAIPMVACGDSSKTQSELDLLKETIEELTDRLDDLTTENGELTDKIEALNVFTSDKAEYGERETMTVYFKNIPVLKIKLRFDTLGGTALSGGSFACTMTITSLCADIYAESILSTMFLVWDNGSCLRKNATSTTVLKKNEETLTGGYFADTQDAYANGTKFDVAICVPGTPFELARFKNVSHTK